MTREVSLLDPCVASTIWPQHALLGTVFLFLFVRFLLFLFREECQRMALEVAVLDPRVTSSISLQRILFQVHSLFLVLVCSFFLGAVPKDGP